MRKRLVIYCEGQTEELFVERLLRQHLSHYGVKVERPILAATSFNPAGQRGGFVHWEAIDFDLRQEFLSDDDPDLRFTTLLDVYRMPSRVLELGGFTAAVSGVADVEKLERSLEQHFGEKRFKAYLQRHEMEALVLADMDALDWIFHRDGPGLKKLRADISAFANPEDINHGPETHPAARLSEAIAGYDDLKAENAYFALARVGIETIRLRCQRFDAWLKHWEAWGMSSPS